jgi:hypothetical protein
VPSTSVRSLGDGCATLTAAGVVSDQRQVCGQSGAVCGPWCRCVEAAACWIRVGRGVEACSFGSLHSTDTPQTLLTIVEEKVKE